MITSKNITDLVSAKKTILDALYNLRREASANPEIAAEAQDFYDKVLELGLDSFLDNVRLVVSRQQTEAQQKPTIKLAKVKARFGSGSSYSIVSKGKDK